MISESLISDPAYHRYRFRQSLAFSRSVTEGFSSFTIPPDAEEDPSIPPENLSSLSAPFLFPPPGCDGVPLEALHDLPSVDSLQAIASLFNLCESDGFIAEPWRLAHVVCISEDDYTDSEVKNPQLYKWNNTSDNMDLDKFKYIFLHSNPYRIFSIMQAKRFANHVRGKISKVNRGFFPANTIKGANKRCPEVSLLVNHILSNQIDCHLILIDLGIGYGSMLHSSIRSALKSQHFSFPPAMVNLAFDSLADRKVVFFGPEGTLSGTSPIELSQGRAFVCGDNLHRILFCLVLDPLLKFITDCRPDFGIPINSDCHFDVLMFSGQLLMAATTEKMAKRMITKVVDYCAWLGLGLDPSDVLCSKIEFQNNGSKIRNSQTGIELPDFNKISTILPKINRNLLTQFPLASHLSKLISD
ncbi:hypothetical protein RCL1_002972 [Eukaryota sp. TZLM3-RCL]